MDAIVFRRHGGTEVLEYTLLPTPQPQPGEVLVRLQAAALNRMDLLVRNGWQGLKLALPHIPGADGAGLVAATGDGVSGFQAGDAVAINANLGCGCCAACLKGEDNRCDDWHLLGETVPGTYAQYICVPARQLYKLPAGFNPHIAAAAGLVFLTAWHSLVTRGNLQSGEWVAIVGAGGGVNTASLQIAKLLGARVAVIGSNAEKLARAEACGAELLIDRAKEADWAKALFAASGRRGMDVVVDNVGSTFLSSLRVLRKGGRLLTVGNSAAPRFEIDNRFIFARHLSIIGSTMGTRQEFARVMDLVTSGALKPVMDRTFELREAAAAQDRLWRGENFGKISLNIS